MNQKTFILFMISLISLLCACSHSTGEEPTINEAENTFIGIIKEVSNQTAIVQIEEGEILKSGDQAVVNLEKANNQTFEICRVNGVTFNKNNLMTRFIF